MHSSTLQLDIGARFCIFLCNPERLKVFKHVNYMFIDDKPSHQDLRTFWAFKCSALEVNADYDQ